MIFPAPNDYMCLVLHSNVEPECEHLSAVLLWYYFMRLEDTADGNLPLGFTYAKLWSACSTQITHFMQF